MVSFDTISFTGTNDDGGFPGGVGKFLDGPASFGKGECIMNFADQWATDEAGNRFLFTVEMQRKLDEAGLPIEPESLAELGKKPPLIRDEPEPESAFEAESSTIVFVDAADEYDDDDQDAGEEEDEDDDDKFQPTSVQIDPESGKYIGRLKWYNPGRGYGFIARGAGEDIFFHRSDMIGNPEELEEGSWLLYDVEETQKGLEASEIEIYNGDPTQLY